MKKGRTKGLSKRIAAVLLSVALMMDGTSGMMTVKAAQDVTASKQEVNEEEVNAEETGTKTAEEVNAEEAGTKSIEESNLEESDAEESETKETETKKTEETETKETETKKTEETETKESEINKTEESDTEETETKKTEETSTEESESKNTEETGTEESETETKETETETETVTETETETEGIIIEPYTGEMPVMENEPIVELAETDFSKGFDTLMRGDEDLARNGASVLPKKLDASQYFTSVKDQGSYGTCWAHATMGLMEQSLNSKGIMTNPNLSEWHLAYFGYNTGYDALDNASNDTMSCNKTGKDFYDQGGNYWIAANRLMNWQGAADETQYPYTKLNSGVYTIDRTKAQDTVAILKDCYFIPTSDVVINGTADKKAELRNQLKTLIKTYGGIMWSYYDEDKYRNQVNKDGNLESVSYFSDIKDEKTNHAIAVVGWDDDYSIENYPEGRRPQNNGAWLVRNSWGKDFGKDGYFYISYEEPTLGCGNAASVFVAEKKSNYDNNYFYNNVVNNKLPYIENINKTAVVYQAKKEYEQLKAVSFIQANANVDYSIQIYKIDSEDTVTDPESGTALLTTPVIGKTPYSGVYTVDISEQILLQKDDRFAIVVTFPSKNGKVYTSPANSDNVTVHDECAPGQMFINRGSSWTDCGKASTPYSFNLNALTKNVNDSDFGTILSITQEKPTGIQGDVKNKLSWTAVSGDASYDIYRKETGITVAGNTLSLDTSAEEEEVNVEMAGTYEKIATVNTCVYDDVIPCAGWNKNFTYKIVVNGEDSNEVNTHGYAVKPFISSVSCDSSGQVTVSWQSMTGATGYVVECSIGNTGNFTVLESDCTATQYIDNTSGKSVNNFYYRIKAKNANAESSYSDTSVTEAGTVDTRFTVRFLGMDGSVIKTQKVRPGESASAPSAPSVEGYTFKGWNGDYSNITRDTDITAEYTPIQYKIKYVLNGGTNDPSNPDTYSAADSVTLKDAKHSTKYFDGWYENSSLTGERVKGIPSGSKGDKTFYAKWADTKEIKIDSISDQPYSGSEIRPISELRITYGSDELAIGRDYTVEYKKNINVTDEARIIITYQGQFSGTDTVYFRIVPKSLDGVDISAVDMAATYSGKTQSPKPVIKWGTKTLTKDKDYTLSYNGNFTEPAEYTITANGIGNYTGKKDIKFTIVAKDDDKRLMSKVTIAKKIPNKKYDGSTFTPSAKSLTLKYKNETLTPDVDYTVQCPQSCKDAGTYNVEIIGKGKYAGSISTSFKITGESISGVKVKQVEYSAGAKEPEITDSKGNKLAKGRDYEIDALYSNVSAGKGKIVLIGRGKYTGKVTKSFTIAPHSIAASDVSISFANGTQPYNKGGAKPQMNIRYKGETLIEGTDYKLSCSANTKVGATATVKITGINNFKDSVKKTFTVAKNNMSSLDVYVPDKVYSSKANAYKSTPVVTDTNGKKLQANTDFKIESYKAGGTVLDKKYVAEVGTVITVTIVGTGKYEGRLEATYRILDKSCDISKATVTVESQYFDGREKTLTTRDIDIKIGKDTWLGSNDYRILEDTYKNNIKKGTAKVTIEGIGVYGGRKTIRFKIKAHKVE